MAQFPDRRPIGSLLTDAELEEFRVLAREHAGADLASDEAQSVAGQILRVLAIVCQVARRDSSASASSVDAGPLPESPRRAITTVPDD